MHKTAVIYSCPPQRHREFAQRLCRLDLFAEILTCDDLATLENYLAEKRVDTVFHPLTATPAEAIKLIAELISLARKHASRICFLTREAEEKLFASGRLPQHSCCLNPEADDALILATLQDRAQSAPVAPDSSPAPDPPACNHYTFGKFLAQEISRSALTGRPFALLLIEPAPAHACGKNVTAWENCRPELARIIGREIRSCDIFSHFQSVGFLILLPETLPEMSELVFARIKERIAAHTDLQGIPFTFRTLPREAAQQFTGSAQF